MSNGSQETTTEQTTDDTQKEVKPPTPLYVKMMSISDIYLSDIECIHEMLGNVLPILKSQDNLRSKQIQKILNKAKLQAEGAEAEGAEAEGAEAEGAEAEGAEAEGAEAEGAKAEGAKAEGSTGGEIKLSISYDDLRELISNLSKIRRSEHLLRQQSIVSLISRFDNFLGDLLEIVLRVHPEWLSDSDKTITYKDLVKLESVEQAINNLISKEIENLLRGSHEDQISFIDTKLKIGIKNSFEKLPGFLEIAERRNLLVHTGGKVSQQYIDKCNNFGYKQPEKVNLGDCLDNSDEYFYSAFNICYECGLRISQAAFRRIFPDHLIKADRSLNHLAIKCLESANWRLAEIICEFDIAIPEKLRSADGEYLYYAIINRAIAQKNLNKEIEPGLKGIPWQAFHPKYTLGLNVLRDEYENAAILMKNPTVAEEITKTGFRTWPLFKSFRLTPEFKAAYKEIYNEEYVPDIEIDSEPKSDTDDAVC